MLTTEDEPALDETIREQESRTIAEIRFCVPRRCILRSGRFAWKRFDGVGMRGTASRNGALIVMMPPLGETLSQHWPRQDDDVNELPEEILR